MIENYLDHKLENTMTTKAYSVMFGTESVLDTDDLKAARSKQEQHPDFYIQYNAHGIDIYEGRHPYPHLGEQE